MTLPDRIRAWWRRYWTDVFMAAFYAGCAAGGLAGFTDPSITLERVLGAGALLYAAGMSAFGLLGVLSVVARSRSSESVCLIAITVLSLLQGTILAFSVPDGGGIVTGARLAASPFGGLVLAHYRRQVIDGLTRSTLDAQITAHDQAADQAADHAAERAGGRTLGGA